MGSVVVVTGAGSPLGRRIVVAIAADPAVARVVAVDPVLHVDGRRRVEGSAEVRVAPFGLGDPRLADAVTGATELVHLGPSQGPELDGTGGTDADVPGFIELLRLLGEVGVIEHLVVVSSALVYGSRDDNPVPLTEAAPVRPDPLVPAAVAKAEVERLARAWAAERGARCAVLRPSLVVGPENGRWFARSPWSGAGVQVSGAESPVQFLHVDDLVSAVEVVRHRRVDGVINVAPDGWLTSEQLRELKGPTPRIRLPRRLALAVARLTSRVRPDQGDPTAVVASAAPWVVANDRLRAIGWAPTHSSEEAFVVADPGGPWSRLTPRHRQVIALGAVGAGLSIATLGVLVVVFRARRRYRNRSVDR
jgi:nucleoside-diphosphate-sugar epimerase